MTDLINKLPPLEEIYRALALAGLQLAVLASVLVVISLLVRLVLGRAEAIPALQKYADRSHLIRKKINKTLVLLFVFLGLVILAGNGYLVYQGVDVLDYSRNWIAQLGADFWIRLGIGLAKAIALFIVALFLVRRIEKVLMKLMNAAKAYKNIKANDESIAVFFNSLNSIQTIAIWLLAAFFAVQVLPFPAGAADALLLILKVYLIVALGLLALKAVAAIVDSLNSLAGRYREPEKFLGIYEKLSGLMPLMRRCLEATVFVIMASLVVAQMDFIAQLAAYGPPLIQAIGIFFISRVVVEISNLLVDKTMLEGKELTDAEKQGLQTIVPIFKSMLSYVIYFIAFVLILRALSLNPLPLLAGAGIVGVVFGLGAQPLINDVVSGLFILFEKLYLVGDFIETGTARGVVENIQLRTTRIRDPDGQLHILRNGQLGEVVNFSKGYTYAVVEVGVAYDSNLDHVYEVLEKTGEELKAANPDVLEPTSVQGLDNFGESELTIRTLTRVKPGRHRQAARQYRKMIKDAFDREGIEIPFAQRVITFQNQPEGGVIK
ncbi:MAG: mechanosensitive ion channel family protein [Gammaproteobacteria bacterium]